MLKSTDSTIVVKEREKFPIKNVFIDSPTRYNETESFILGLTIYCHYKNPSLERYFFKAKDLMKLIGVKNQDWYHKLDVVTSTITSKPIELYQGTDKSKKRAYRKFPVYSEIAYANGVIMFELHNKILPFLNDEAERFSYITILALGRLKTTPRVVLYQKLAQFQNGGIKHYKLDDFYNETGIQYSRFYDCERKFLKPSIRLINDVAHFTVDYEVKREGNRKRGQVSALIFKIKTKSEKQLQTLEKQIDNVFIDNNVQELVNKILDLANRYKFDTNENRILKIVEKYQDKGFGYLYEQIEIIDFQISKKNYKIDNIEKILQNAFKEGYDSTELRDANKKKEDSLKKKKIEIELANQKSLGDILYKEYIKFFHSELGERANNMTDKELEGYEDFCAQRTFFGSNRKEWFPFEKKYNYLKSINAIKSIEDFIVDKALENNYSMWKVNSEWHAKKNEK